MTDDLLTKQLAEMRKLFESKGFSGPVGYGSHPCLLIVDFVNAFTDTSSPLGGDYTSQIEATKKLLSQARASDVPVIFSTVSYDDVEKDAGIWIKKSSANYLLKTGSEWVKVDSRLAREDGETVLVKRYPSCFFGTDLLSQLISSGIDTILVAGCSTSGCVRASVVDACSYGFHVIVVEDAVGDRTELVHRVSLFDIEAKYGDVRGSTEVMSYLEGIAVKQSE